MYRIMAKARIFAGLVKLEHTVFALPFAYIGALLGRGGLPSCEQFFWITLAMVGARSAAMGLNRVIDRFIDRDNPRTAGRHLPRGLIAVREVKVFIVISLLVFLYCVYRLSPAHLGYTPVIIAFLAGYSYTKRFTWLSHLALGAAIGFAPLGGWVGVTREIAPAALILGAVVCLWMAGLDIIYATQDLEFDREYGLFSMPAALGLEKALSAARMFHFFTALLLFCLYFLLDLGGWYLAGVIITSGLLYYENSLVSPRDLSRVSTAFFNVNGLISVQLLMFTVLDVVL